VIPRVALSRFSDRAFPSHRQKHGKKRKTKIKLLKTSFDSFTDNFHIFFTFIVDFSFLSKITKCLVC
jgi:hypothetical protein